MSVSKSRFGELSTGETIHMFHLENKAGAYAEVLEFGAILVKICVPDKKGQLTDVLLGYDDMKGYEKNGCYFGAVIGRSGNRIAGGEFMIGDQKVTLAKNENENNLHSGPNGFEKKIWSVGEVSQEKNSVVFTRISPDGENGFPGEFHVSVKYEFTEENELKIHYRGMSDAPTVANLTNHAYFNLSGEGSGTVLDQNLVIHARYYTPVQDNHAIPTGEYAAVEGTPMDFRTAKKIGAQINDKFEQLIFTGGYDHNYVTDNYAKGNRRLIASASSPITGIVMNVTSDCPCVQLYAGNFISGEHGKNGHIYQEREGFCLETQVEPNAVNVEDFHSPVIEAGEQYHSTTTYCFSTK